MGGPKREGAGQGVSVFAGRVLFVVRGGRDPLATDSLFGRFELFE